MKVLTIKQQWTTLIMQGNKKIEFKSWQTKYRGDLLRHMEKGIIDRVASLMNSKINLV